MMKFKVLVLLLIVLQFVQGYSQNKDEQEYSIGHPDLPKRAKTLLEQIPSSIRRIKYFFETDGDKTSFEAKFKYKKYRYSIEFDQDGNLEDIEIELKKNQLIPKAHSSIKEYLSYRYKKFYILKIQKQYRPDAQQSPEQTLQKALYFQYHTKSHFELIVQVVDFENSPMLFEMTFNPDGHLILKRALEPSSYEHVLY